MNNAEVEPRKTIKLAALCKIVILQTRWVHGELENDSEYKQFDFGG